MPHSPRDSSKNAVLVPPKLSSDFDCCAVFSPRTVLEVLGQHFFQSHSENCGIIAHYYMVLPLLLLLGGKHFIQDRLENHGILGVLFFRMPLFKQGAF